MVEVGCPNGTDEAGYERRITARAFLAAMRRLNQEHAALTDHLPRKSIDVGTAVEYIRTFTASWAKAKPPTRATMIQSVYGEIVVRGEEFVSVRLTPEAYAHGLALALPTEVSFPPFRPGADRGADQIWHWRARQDSRVCVSTRIPG